MARPKSPERNVVARSFRQFRRFLHLINADKVFGTHRWAAGNPTRRMQGKPLRKRDPPFATDPSPGRSLQAKPTRGLAVCCNSHRLCETVALPARAGHRLLVKPPKGHHRFHGLPGGVVMLADPAKDFRPAFPAIETTVTSVSRLILRGLVARPAPGAGEDNGSLGAAIHSGNVRLIQDDSKASGAANRPAKRAATAA
jgi:hypothetical protein